MPAEPVNEAKLQPVRSLAAVSRVVRVVVRTRNYVVPSRHEWLPESLRDGRCSAAYLCGSSAR